MVSWLACYLTNPGPEYQAAANQTLLYLKRYRDLDLQLGGGDEYLMASDASFADNTARPPKQRKSSCVWITEADESRLNSLWTAESQFQSEYSSLTWGLLQIELDWKRKQMLIFLLCF